MVGRVETDSRTIHAGSLFVPLVGERFDGHAYINAALEGGAAGCFTQRERESYLPGKFYIKVDSTQRALRDLAKYYKKKFPIPVVALTGSVGKTTTKEMIACVLESQYATLKTQGNFNNEVGLPKTLFGLEDSHEAAVIEMGMSHFGEISRLSRTAEPCIGVITNIGYSHIEKPQDTGGHPPGKAGDPGRHGRGCAAGGKRRRSPACAFEKGTVPSGHLLRNAQR